MDLQTHPALARRHLARCGQHPIEPNPALRPLHHHAQPHPNPLVVKRDRATNPPVYATRRVHRVRRREDLHLPSPIARLVRRPPKEDPRVHMVMGAHRRLQLTVPIPLGGIQNPVPVRPHNRPVPHEPCPAVPQSPAVDRVVPVPPHHPRQLFYLHLPNLKRMPQLHEADEPRRLPVHGRILQQLPVDQYP